MRTVTLIAATFTAAAALVAAPAAARPLKPAEEARIRPAGRPVDCLFIPQIRETRVRSDQVIDFYTLGGKVYRNTLPNRCPRLGFEERFAYKTSLSRLCSVDIITVFSTGAGGMPGPSCGLGQFQPITGAPR